MSSNQIGDTDLVIREFETPRTETKFSHRIRDNAPLLDSAIAFEAQTVVIV